MTRNSGALSRTDTVVRGDAIGGAVAPVPARHRALGWHAPIASAVAAALLALAGCGTPSEARPSTTAPQAARLQVPTSGPAQIDVAGLPPVSAAELSDAERSLTREISAAIAAPLTVAEGLPLEEYTSAAQTQVRPWIESRIALAERLARASPEVRPNVAAPLLGVLAIAVVDCLERLPLPRELVDDAGLTELLRAPLREHATWFADRAFRALSACREEGSDPWSGAACNLVRGRVAQRLERSRAATPPAAD